MKRSKKYVASVKLIDKGKIYSANEAIELIKKMETAKFDASIDIAIKLNLDTTKADQQLRGTIALPHFFGKPIRILAIDDTLTNDDAKTLGINVGQTDVINDIKNG